MGSGLHSASPAPLGAVSLCSHLHGEGGQVDSAFPRDPCQAQRELGKLVSCPQEHLLCQSCRPGTGNDSGDRAQWGCPRSLPCQPQGHGLVGI